MNHRLPIESGRFCNIERSRRICNLCNLNQLGDEFHYILECTFFSEHRRRYIDSIFFKRPNVIKFSELMSSKEQAVLTKLAIFCKTVINHFDKGVVRAS